MKSTTLQDIVEQIAKRHLGVGNLSVAEVRNLSVYSLKSALVEAVKIGEKLGYSEGYQNAKSGCRVNDQEEECDCESITF